MIHSDAVRWLWRSLMLLAVAVAGLGAVDPGLSAADHTADAYVVLAWNDLGMHCYNGDFDELAVLPPYNTLWAQVVRVADPPEIVTTGIRVEFHLADNTTSMGKSNFWDANPHAGVQNAQWLFGLPAPLPADTGLTGVGLWGDMELHGDHFVAEGIPLTEYRDSAPQSPYPYQLATVTAYDASTGAELAHAVTVAPVSTEMHCDFCHSDYGPGNEEIGTGVVERNILMQHDAEEGTDLMGQRPVLCAACHASNALGAPGVPEVPNFSAAMHGEHAEHMGSALYDCYSCHPGPQTQCLRDVMSQGGMECADCHGTLMQVAQNPEPWLLEPRCDGAACHGSGYAQDQPLYRMSQEHGGVYCEACHDSPHAIAPSREDNDALKFLAWQGHNGPLDICTVCHLSQPDGPGPHDLPAPAHRSFTFGPDRFSAPEPGAVMVYLHTLRNTGNLSDTYTLDWSTSQGWAIVLDEAFPLTLDPAASALVTVTVTVPEGQGVRGLIDSTVLTATSTFSPTLVASVTDRTLVPLARVYLPVLARMVP